MDRAGSGWPAGAGGRRPSRGTLAGLGRMTCGRVHSGSANDSVRARPLAGVELARRRQRGATRAQARSGAPPRPRHRHAGARQRDLSGRPGRRPDRGGRRVAAPRRTVVLPGATRSRRLRGGGDRVGARRSRRAARTDSRRWRSAGRRWPRRRWRTPPTGPAARGLLALGGFAFAPDGGGSPRWDGFAPASLVVPELSLARSGDRVALTVNVEVARMTSRRISRRAWRRVCRSCARSRCRCSTRRRPGSTRCSARCPRRTTRRRWRGRCKRIRAGELEKIVLAREVEVHAPLDHDIGAVLGLLREAFPSLLRVRRRSR